MFCLAGSLRSDGSVDIGFLGAFAGLAEERQQDDDPATGLPEADPPRGAVERDPQLVDVISVLQLS
jgi:hypothetical protein